MLKNRIITSLIGLPILIAAVWFDRPVHWFTAFIALCGAIAAVEFYQMVAKARVLPFMYFGIVWSLLFIISADTTISDIISPYLNPVRTPLFLLVLAVILPLIWGLRYGENKDSTDRWAWTLAGILYVGVLLSLLVSLRGMDNGRNWVLFALLTTFASDTTAYLVGRKWGRRKLAPAISPGKTQEGAIAGVLGAIVFSLLFVPGQFGSLSNPLFISPLSYYSAVLLGLAVSVFGQVGDLVESMIKRNMNAKDSGLLLPGHGGILDRMDSVAFAGIVVYYFVLWAIQ
jgi:phosphatidate cytidylyltransferase